MLLLLLLLLVVVLVGVGGGVVGGVGGGVGVGCGGGDGGGGGGGENWYKMHRLIIGSRRRITGMAAHDYTQHAKMQNMEIDDCSEIVIPNQYGRERENVLRKLGQSKCSQKIFCLGLPKTNAANI